MGIRIPTKAVCPECERVFDLLDEDDAGEWYYGHDCERPEQTERLPLDRPPRLTHNANGSYFCEDCHKVVILFDCDEHDCEATGTSTTFHENCDCEDE